MNEFCARKELPMWSAMEIPEDVKEYRPKKERRTARTTGGGAQHGFREKETKRTRTELWRRLAAGADMNRIGKRYGILLIAAALFTLYTILFGSAVEHRTEKRVRQELAIEYASRLEAYKAEQAEAVQKEYFLSGDASREAFLNQEIDAAARLCAKMANDTQKGGIICNALARVMSKNYPGSMREVIAQPNQWMFYDEANKFTAHDREIAEKILRAYYEEGIIPTGLSDEYVYGSWSESDYVLRNTWDFSSSTRTWRYQG